MAARLAIARAQRQLAVEANVHLHVRNFAIINQVGAVSLQATLNCDGFAAAHSATSHFDRSSFVGLAWRPPRENICCEVYSTGRANLPGSVTERALLESWSRMLPELLRFSSRAHLLENIPQELQDYHRLKNGSAVQQGGSMPVVDGVLSAEDKCEQPRAIKRRQRPGMTGKREAKLEVLRTQKKEGEEQMDTAVAVQATDIGKEAFDMDDSGMGCMGGLSAALADTGTDNLDLSAFGF